MPDNYYNPYYWQPPPSQFPFLDQTRDMQQGSSKQQPAVFPNQNNQNQRPFTTSIAWVDSEQEAQKLIGTRNDMAILMNNAGDTFWVKYTDNSGLPTPLRLFKYEEIPIQKQDPEYVTKSEIAALMASINQLKEMVQTRNESVNSIQSEVNTTQIAKGDNSKNG